MKNILFLSGLFLSLTLNAGTAPFKAGSWKLADGGCSNPAYTPLPEEKAFWDAVKSGETFDSYTFSDSTHAVYEQKFSFPKGGYCLGTTPFEVKYVADGEVVFNMGQTTWKTVTTGPNVTINCDDNDNTSEKHRYHWKDESLVFTYPQGGNCETFSMIWAKE